MATLPEPGPEDALQKTIATLFLCWSADQHERVEDLGRKLSSHRQLPLGLAEQGAVLHVTDCYR